MIVKYLLSKEKIHNAEKNEDFVINLFKYYFSSGKKIFSIALTAAHNIISLLVATLSIDITLSYSL